ncbi:hypothetical protein FRP1_18955 [Pseudonocardia sp. EC080625-04]|nr:hypothetical protein FRP1_18955 [Pseudonocardia sp. EC080625-04]
MYRETSVQVPTDSRSSSSSRTVTRESPVNRSARVPASGFASRTTARSPRCSARASPRQADTVVFPTPPLTDMTATRCAPGSGPRMRVSRASRRSSASLGPGLTRPPVTSCSIRRQPVRGRSARGRSTSASRRSGRAGAGGYDGGSTGRVVTGLLFQPVSVALPPGRRIGLGPARHGAEE